eukprot:c34411_g1_i1 orf=345-1307(-)
MAYSSVVHTSWAFWMLRQLLVLALLAPLGTGSRMLPLSDQNTARRGRNRPSSVTISGSVFCDQCVQQRFTKNSSILHGAIIAAECKAKRSTVRTVRVTATTDQNGMFKLEIPTTIARSPRRLRRCVVLLVSSPIKSCSAQPSIPKPFSSMSLKSKLGSHYIYSAGFLSYTPDSPASFCHKNTQRIAAIDKIIASTSHKKTHSISNITEPAALPPVPFLPPIPYFTSPPLVPGLPSIPLLPQPPSLPPLILPPIPILTPPSFPPLPVTPVVPYLPLPPLILPPLPLLSPPVTPSLPPLLPGLPPLPSIPLPPLSTTLEGNP